MNAAAADGTAISNTASVIDPLSGDTNDSSTAATSVNAGAVTLAKTASPSSAVAPGDVVTYTLTATNTGTVALNGVTISDAKPGLSALSCRPANGSTLAIGAMMTCTATRTVTQDDVDTGTISNTAAVDATTVNGNPVAAGASATATADQRSDVSLSKTASPSSGVVAGDVVTYTFTGQNTGTVTLHDVSIDDTKAGLSALSCTPAAPASLAAGGAISCTATRTVTQEDVNDGTIVNTATINGLDPTNAVVSTTASATVTADRSKADPRLTKKLQGADGSTARWLVTVTNDGDGTLAGPFTVTEELPGGLSFESAGGSGWVCAGTGSVKCTHDADLAAGASTSFTVVTTITGTGEITNVVSLDVLGGHLEASASYRPTKPSDSGEVLAASSPFGSSTSNLAFTGSSPWRLSLFGLLTVVFGALMLAVLRKRQDRTETPTAS